MKIKSVEILNIKGISSFKTECNLTPNKINIFVAPNGFGKTSLSKAFGYLSNSKINLAENDTHNNDRALIPQIKIEVEETTGISILSADNTNNDIKGRFNVSVINSQLKPSGTNQRYMGRSINKHFIDIEPTILLNTIPTKEKLDYKITNIRRDFGNNGKVLVNIENFLYTRNLLNRIISEVGIGKIKSSPFRNKVKTFVDEINKQSGIANIINNWIEQNVGNFLNQYSEIKNLVEIIHSYRFENNDTLGKSFLFAWQIVYLFNKKTEAQIRKICNSGNYEYFLEDTNNFLSDCNTTRFEIKAREEKGKLVVHYPKAHEISNGQRDILNFLALLLKFRANLRENTNQILIIDEVFDYLDDANLTAFQYFITNLVDEAKDKNINLFPILLTHLDPNFFNHFCFNEKKLQIHYLKEHDVKNTQNLHKLIYQRENPSIKDNLDTYFFHFHPDNTINIENDFYNLGLPKEWGKVKKFHKKIFREVEEYLDDKPYDPLAICFALRKVIEMKVYNQITDNKQKNQFLDTHKTKEKLNYAYSIGIDIPETYYLLGLIYNTSLHLKQGQDITKSLAMKLDNLTIKNMVKEIYSYIL
ncbi:MULTISPECIES: hypothetical protein [Capnocytophaga]|uniref:Uncharacterized protein n=1 Tax=Capnocytophaga stomatis TaxID=1848904 RepID=A0A250FU69_9FLAO|nr:hypothetical protein [Capnocytophaga stomatis]ATA88692.1 hypothetical protein CGC58_02420 [Capnocytophaga stomatis]